jgi:hypothetical protein
MTPPENGKPLWDESRVEMLLEEFFPSEIPAPLREPNPSRIERIQLAARSSSATAPMRAANSRANSKTGGLMVGFTLMLMLMMALIVGNPLPQNRGVPQSNPDNPSHSQSGNQDEGSLEALKHNGQGPIELRPRIHAVGTEDPEHPASGRSPFPELDVEVYPLDGEAPANPEKSRKPSVQKPMPEEGRKLPESQPPATDPDEAQLEPMLPELQAIFSASGLD